jgi:hypothetical protein
MCLYTFIMDFRGGTYISQVMAKNVASATKKWANQLDTTPIKHMGPAAKAEIIREMNNEIHYPVLLSGMSNVWCISCSIRVGFFLLNIVES